MARRFLERAGFKVLVASDGIQAVDVFRDRAGEIAVVLLDVTMPRLGGLEAFQQIRAISNSAKVILSSGYDERESEILIHEQGLAGFIQKPYRSRELLAKICAVLRDG